MEHRRTTLFSFSRQRHTVAGTERHPIAGSIAGEQPFIPWTACAAIHWCTAIGGNGSCGVTLGWQNEVGKWSECYELNAISTRTTNGT
jgi:hypothetical protein